MKHITLTTVTAAMFASSAFAGDYIPSAPSAPVESIADAVEDLPFTPYLDGRLRIESREVNGLDQSTAGTISLSPGIKTKSFGGFSALVEGEFTYAFADDYRSLSPDTTPHVLGNTPILDPETEELNQAYLQYAGSGFTAKVGRQRIIYDKAAFIGNVGWRQNEQTYDAASLSYKADAYTLNAAYIDQVNRIFGSDAPGALRELDDGQAILLNASSEYGGAYAYLIDFDDAHWAQSNTYGAYTTLNGFYLEGAYQDIEGGVIPEDSAYYGHISYSHKVAGGTGTLGVEYLSDHFSTPLATVHAFNGFADAFAIARVTGGLSDGLTDVYASYVKKGLPLGLVFKGFLHYYMDGDMDQSLGYEADAVIAKKLNDNMTIVSKFAYFDGDNGLADIKQASLQLDFKF